MSEALVEESTENAMDPYPAVSKSAVMSLVIALMSVSVLLGVTLLPLPLLGVILGTVGLYNIRKYPQELTGEQIARIGIAGCALLFVGGIAFHTIVYFTEVPEGYTRVNFRQLQPSPQRKDIPVSAEALELDGTKVFVTGYVYPDGQKSGITRFVLVPDMGTCCFGGQPKLTDMIEVQLVGDETISYSMTRRKLGGLFKVSTEKKPVDGLDGVYYQLECDLVK